MGRSEVRLEPDARFIRWIHNFEKLGHHVPTEHARREWTLAVEVMFAATQQYAHVDSGDMLDSGKMSAPHVDGSEVTVEISYGGTRKSDAKPWWKHQFVDYTKYELKRGGSHDFIKRASTATHRRLQQGAGNALVKILEAEEW